MKHALEATIAGLLLVAWCVLEESFGAAALVVKVTDLIFRAVLLEAVTTAPDQTRIWIAFTASTVVFVSLTGYVIRALSSYARRVLPPNSLAITFIRLIGGGLILMYVLNAGEGAGIEIAIAAVVLVLLTVALIPLADRFAIFATLVLLGFWAGLLTLSVTGFALLANSLSDATRTTLQHQHALYGFIWIAIVASAAVRHVRRYPGRWTGPWLGQSVWLAVFLVVVAVTGLMLALFGREGLFHSTTLHIVGALGTLGLLVVHMVRHRQALASSRLSEAGQTLRPTSVVAFFVLLVLPLLHVGATALQQRSRAAELPPNQTDSPLHVVDVGTAPRAAAAAIPDAGIAGALAVGDGLTTCASFGGCHVDILQQWQASMHRYAANPVYRSVVQLLAAEQGVAATALCARCHDPVALFTGDLVAGNTYPTSASEGVTCVACHWLRPEAGPPGNGEYALTLDRDEIDRLRHLFTSYMFVADDKQRHREIWAPANLQDNETCAPCHQLSLNGLELRSTFEEWRRYRDAVGDDAETCTSCHMPKSSLSYLGSVEAKNHDHSFLDGHVGLAQQAGGSVARSQQFLAAALTMDAAARRLPDGRIHLAVQLRNTGVGHNFPSAPKDLIEYWLEVTPRDSGGAELPALRQNVPLFEETLVDALGNELRQHEIWKAFHARTMQSIAPGGELLSDVFVPAEAVDVRTVEVRLLHRRYRRSFVSGMGLDEQLVHLESLEILSLAKDVP